MVNQVRPQDLDADDLAAARAGALDPAAVARDLASVGTEASDSLVQALLTEAHDHAERRALEDAQRAVVDRLDVPTYELPRLASGIDVGALYELAALLKKQGMA